MSGAAAWRIEGEVGCLSCGPLAARVEADGMGVRLLVASWRGMPSDAFGALITAGPGPRPPVIEVKEQYVRGCDFVASYARSADFPVAPQFYWRAAQHASLSAVQIQMILSVQTDLLDSHPEASVNSFALESQLFHASRLDAAAFEEAFEHFLAPAVLPDHHVVGGEKIGARETLRLARMAGAHQAREPVRGDAPLPNVLRCERREIPDRQIDLAFFELVRQLRRRH